MTCVELPRNLSYSQKSSLGDCAGRYYLERALKVPQRPGWANIGGTAAHSTTEELDRRLYEAGEHVDSLDDIRGIFESFFAEETTKQENVTKFDRTEFRASGRASKEWPDKEDVRWWAQKGPEMCLAWVRWRDASPWLIAYLPTVNLETGEVENTLAIEVAFSLPAIGDESPVIGKVDRVQVQETPDGPIYLVNDLKFGSREPDSSEQLDTYRFGLKHDYDIDPRWGTFWMGRKAMNTAPVDLHATPIEKVEYDYRMANEQRLRGDFRYHPNNNCTSWCSVKEYCPVAGGQYASTVPQPWELTAPPTLRPPKDDVS